MAHEGYHEPIGDLPEAVRDIHRAIISLIEEFEAVDWYYQRAAATHDESLKAILLHNAHEEAEHAMMTLEWLRRKDPVIDQNMRKYLFTEGSIVQSEAASKGAASDALAAAVAPRRTLGSLRPDRRNP